MKFIQLSPDKRPPKERFAAMQLYFGSLAAGGLLTFALLSLSYARPMRIFVALMNAGFLVVSFVFQSKANREK
jgi:hypothetical protein